MNDQVEQQSDPSVWRTWLDVLTAIMVILAGFVLIGPVIGLFIALPLYDGSLEQFLAQANNPTQSDGLRVPLMVFQGCVTTIGLGIVPAFYWWRSKRISPIGMIGTRISIQSTLFAILAMIFFLGPVSLFIYWNSNIELPDGGFENFVRRAEDRALVVTTYMTSFASFSEFIIGLVVIAVLPSICEELAFRGILQPELHRASKNIHVAIWVSSILFSALHLQFYGFFPRVLLGAMFGYLYFWSGNLLIPMIAHVVNNGLQVILIYFGQKEIAGVDLESPAMPSLTTVGVMTALWLAFTYLYRRSLPPKPDPA